MTSITSLWISLFAGCVPGSVTANVTADAKNISVKYGSFVANAGPSFGYDDNRKNCQLTLSVKVPAGYQFAFDRFSHNGAYSIAAGVKATYNTSYYFQAAIEEAQGGTTSLGPAKEDGALTGLLTPILWSPCGQNVLVGINTAVRVDNSANTGASGTLTMRNTPSTNFVWRTC
ncbi:hypothetical protein B0H34DRAFT_152669 [Crassisporium funariophilum]|nr:hypothetical protein B0H34DRAFT_152669 [Crassisporium funariophilum]